MGLAMWVQQQRTQQPQRQRQRRAPAMRGRRDVRSRAVALWMALSPPVPERRGPPSRSVSALSALLIPTVLVAQADVVLEPAGSALAAALASLLDSLSSRWA